MPWSTRNSKSKGSVRKCNDVGLCKAVDGEVNISVYRAEDSVEGELILPPDAMGRAFTIPFKATWHGKKMFCG